MSVELIYQVIRTHIEEITITVVMLLLALARMDLVLKKYFPKFHNHIYYKIFKHNKPKKKYQRRKNKKIKITVKKQPNK
tara:strand:+ start:303 stop:539 length:237 start_codon:yes stop_codon:yes gene_type:complete